MGSCTSNTNNLVRSPSGPCWNVYLGDGFSSGQELIDTYHCLNNTHNFDAFSETIETLSQLDRNETPLQDTAAEICNSLFFSEEINLFPLIETFLTQHPEPTISLINVLQISLYGNEPVTDAFDQRITTDGLLYPLFSLLPSVSAHLLDHPEERDSMDSFLFSEISKPALCTLYGLMQDPSTQETVFSLPKLLGEAIHETQNELNDHWALASGNSTYDFLHTIITPQENTSPLERITAPIEVIIQDTRIRSSLKQIVLDNLSPELLPAIEHLITTHRSGRPKTTNETSALFDILEILSHSNTSLECSLSIFSFSISEISIDNFAVTILNRLANQNPDTVRSVLGLLSLLDLGISEWMLDQIVASEACPLLTADFVDRFQALQRLDDPEVEPLLVFGLEIIQLFHHPTQSRLPDLADLITEYHRSDLTLPTEELLRDVIDVDLLSKTIPLISTLPDLDAICPEEITPLEYQDTMMFLENVVTTENVLHLSPLIQAIIEQDHLWLSYRNTGEIFQSPAFSALLPTLHRLDLYQIPVPTMSAQTRTQVYTLLEHSNLNEALFGYAPNKEKPLTWFGTLLLSDAPYQLVDMLQWLNTELDLLAHREE